MTDENVFRQIFGKLFIFLFFQSFMTSRILFLNSEYFKPTLTVVCTLKLKIFVIILYLCIYVNSSE